MKGATILLKISENQKNQKIRKARNLENRLPGAGEQFLRSKYLNSILTIWST